MSQKKNNLENNCKNVLDNIIKNVHPSLYQMLVLDTIASNLENNKKIIERYIRSKINATSKLSKRTKKYWIIRGWSEAEAYIKSKEHSHKKGKSVYSRDFWTKKINPLTGYNYTTEEADFERNSRRPIKKEYWIAKGYSEIESQNLASNVKTQNNKSGAKASAVSTVRKITSKRCVDYYTIRGYSLEEAKILVSEGQKYFSKKICIEKYGYIDGLKIWQERQDKWQNTLNEKSNEEKERINRLKLTKGITVSSIERYIFKEISLIFPEAIHQFTLHKHNKKQYIYDIMYNNKIIEYNGDFWHCNPSKYQAEFVNPRTKIKAIDKWSKDSIKIKFAESQGYSVLVIWESDFKQNKEKVLKECITFLTQ